jgi:hypothetical protein
MLIVEWWPYLGYRFGNKILSSVGPSLIYIYIYIYINTCTQVVLTHV